MFSSIYILILILVHNIHVIMNNNSIRQITDIQSRESKNKPRVPEQDAN